MGVRGAAALTGLADVNLPKILVFWGLAVVLVSTARATARAICHTLAAYIQRTIIVGAGDVGQLVARKILSHPEYGLELAGFVDVAPVDPHPDIAHLPIVGQPDELPELIERLDIDRVIFAFSTESHDSSLTALRACREVHVQSDIVPRLFEMVGPGAGFHTLGGLSLVSLGPSGLSRSSQWVKRAVDIMISATALVVLAPFLALVALLVKLDSPGPVFFRQTRMGAVDRPFRMLQVPHNGARRGGTEERYRASEPLRGQRRRYSDVQGEGRSANNTGRTSSPPVLARRAPRSS